MKFYTKFSTFHDIFFLNYLSKNISSAIMMEFGFDHEPLLPHNEDTYATITLVSALER